MPPIVAFSCHILTPCSHCCPITHITALPFPCSLHCTLIIIISSTHSCCCPCCLPLLCSHHCNLIAAFLLLPYLTPVAALSSPCSHCHALVAALLLPCSHCNPIASSLASLPLLHSHHHILIIALPLPCYHPPLPYSSSS